MTDKSWIDRWLQMIKIAPNDSLSGKSSWNENSQNLLSTEKKIFAIKITEGEKVVGYQPIALQRKKNKSLLLKKWLEKCKWKLPKAIILFSVLQVRSSFKISYQCISYLIEQNDTKLCIVNWLPSSSSQLFFHLFSPTNLAYQTLAFSPVRKLELWRYFTYALLHAGTAHLLINIILQLVISFPLESEVGSRNVLFVYIGGILSGSLAASLSPDFTLMVGASSGVYSLLMSHISHIFMVSLSFR